MSPIVTPSRCVSPVLRVSFIVCAAVLAVSTQARAQTNDVTSIYTSTKPADCRSLTKPRASGPDEGAARLCNGAAGLSVLVQEDDLRETVSIGRDARTAKAEPAAQAWFGPFSSTTATIEWRMAKDGAPFAIIQRWHLADNGDLAKNGQPIAKQLLIVTRLPPGKVCHTALIDVAANADANTLARLAADSARAFDCDKDKVQIAGKPGRATALALPDR